MAFWNRKNKEAEALQNQTKKEQDMLKQNHSHAAQITSKLNAIDFRASDNKLPMEFIEDEALEGVRHFAVTALQSPVEITRDVTGLDEVMEYAADALADAVKNGYQTAAHWSAVALYKGLSNLRTEVSGVDVANEEELYKKRLAYAQNLKLIIEESRILDARKLELIQEKKRYETLQKQREQLKSTYDNFIQTLEGQAVLAELRQSASSPMMLSDRALWAQDQLNDYNAKTKHLKDIQVSIQALHAQVNDAQEKIDTTRNYLALMPTVSDPQLLARIEKMLEEFRSDITRTLNEIEVSRQMLEAHHTKTEMLGNHPVFQDNATRAIRTADQINQEEYLVQSRYIQQLDQLEKQKKNQEIQDELLQAKAIEIQNRYEQVHNVIYHENDNTQPETEEDVNRLYVME